MSTEIILTPDGVQKLEKELTHLKKDRRMEIAERIQTAKEHGDLSENAEYLEAKEDQAFIEGRIAEIEHMLKTATIVEKKADSSVGVGSTVTVRSEAGTRVFEIVGATESDPAQGKISLDSPLGSALVGKTIGDVVEIATPGGSASYTIEKLQ